MGMTRFFVSLIFVFSTVEAFSQKNFVKGYVVTNAGDTLHGEIENRDWKVNPSLINYRKTDETLVEQFSSLQAKAFYLEPQDELFQSFRMELDQVPSDGRHITSANFSAKVEKSFFARVLVKGIVSLYYVYDFKPHYIVEKLGAIHELRMEYRVVEANSLNTGRQIISAHDVYKKQLNIFLHDSPVSLRKQVSRVSLRTNPLKALILAYNNARGVTPSFVQKKETGRNETGVIAGGTVTTNSITGAAYPYMVNSSYEPSTAPTVGIFFNHVFPRNHGKIGWYNELSYVSFHAVSNYTELNLYETRSENHSKFSYIQFFSGARFRYDSYRLRPFFTFGLASSFAMEAKFYTDQKRYLNGQFVDSKVIEYPTQGFSFGLWAGGGAAITKRLDLQLRINRTQGYTNAISYKASVNYFFFTAAYKLNGQ